MAFHEDWYYQGSIDKLNEMLKEFTVEGEFIEIGCWEGKSTVGICNAIAPRILNCVDTFKGNIDEGEDHPTVVKSRERDVRADFEANMAEFALGKWRLHVMDGDEYLNSVKTKVAFIHLDATHTYEAVKKTLEIVSPKMAAGGIMAGDDWQCAPGVAKACKEVLPGVEGHGNLWVYKVV